jgi:hypothetical protein
MDPNELVVILDRAIANLPDPSADGRRRVYERVEKTIRATCTSQEGVLDSERYRALRRDLGTAIAMIEKQTRIAARSHIHPHALPAEAPPPPPPTTTPTPEASVEASTEFADADPLQPGRRGRGAIATGTASSQAGSVRRRAGS